MPLHFSSMIRKPARKKHTATQWVSPHEIENSPQPHNLTFQALPETRFLIAHKPNVRARAALLANRIYHRMGYASATPDIENDTIHDDPEQLFTLLAEYKNQDIATVSLAYEGPHGLPCDEIFAKDLKPLRAQRRRFVEVTRLAIDPEYAHNKITLVLLFNLIYLHARKLNQIDDFIIEVNPRHVNFYRLLLGFELIGEKRPCPRVQGAQACLLRLDLALAEREILKTRQRNTPTTRHNRSLYPFALKPKEEQAVLNYIQNPMNTFESVG